VGVISVMAAVVSLCSLKKEKSCTRFFNYTLF